ncbi:MAG TPA: putative baseplate assembly protein [Vicinamibacterales bacterium]
MALPLPGLDDRRWADLVEEGRSLIPLYAPGWTDHNVHDPGITLIELFAWIAEQDLYRINRIPAAHIRKFLALVGVEPRPPRAARAILAVRPSGTHVDLPADLEVEAQDLAGRWTVFRTLHALSAVGIELKAILSAAGRSIVDLTARWRRGEALAMLGADPAVGAAVYFGFDGPLPPGVAVTLHFRFAGGRTGREERERLLAEAHAAAAECPPPGPVHPCRCNGALPDDRTEGTSAPGATLPPATARTIWEIQVAPGIWRALDSTSEAIDDTRGFTLDGRVTITAPAATVATRVGPVSTPYHYLRCRMAGGFYDAAPQLAHVVVNGLEIEQAESVATTWPVAKGAVISGPLPSPGDETALALHWNAKREIDAIEFADREPRLRILAFSPPATTTAGSLVVEAAALGAGSGEPFQTLTLPRAPGSEGVLDLVVFEEGGAAVWTAQPDFDRSGRADAHFVLDAGRGLLTFGDGEHGRRLPAGATAVARYRATRGSDGNLPAGRSWRIPRNPHNLAIPGIDAIVAGVAALENPAPAEGGAAAESLADAAARAVDSVEQPLRAVTAADYEALALSTPGVRLARAAARPNLDPAQPCLHATGVITVIVVPFQPRQRPVPGAATRRAVARYLARRRLIGTRVVVVGPTYLEVGVRARVRALARIDPARLQRRIVAALERFFDPLSGGPDGSGWPFGRDVYRSEVLQAIDEVPGVDHVLSLELLAGCACHGPVCGNVCVGPIGLVTSGRHEIAVE